MPKKNEKDRRLFKQWIKNKEIDENLASTNHNLGYFLRNRGGRKSKKNSKKSKKIQKEFKKKQAKNNP